MKKIIFLTLLSVMFVGSAYGVITDPNLDAPMDGSAVDIVGSATATPNPSGTNVFGAPAVVGQALQVNNTDQPGVEYAGPAIDTGAMAVSLWVTADDSGSPDWGRIFTAGNASIVDALVIVRADDPGELYIHTHFSSDPDHDFEGVWLSGLLGGTGFTHIVGTYDPATGTSLYVNGALAGNDTSMGGLPLPPIEKCAVGVGVYETGYGYLYPGSFDMVKVFAHGLDQTDVDALYWCA